jgi:hypothetical protein
MLAGNQFRYLHTVLVRLLTVHSAVALKDAPSRQIIAFNDAMLRRVGIRRAHLRGNASEMAHAVIASAEQKESVSALCEFVREWNSGFELPAAKPPQAHTLTGRTYGIERSLSLSGRQFLELRAALLDTDPGSLPFVLRAYCDRDPGTLSTEYQPLVWPLALAKLISVAEAEGWIDDLPAAAARFLGDEHYRTEPMVISPPARTDLVRFLNERYDWRDLRIMLSNELGRDFEVVVYRRDEIRLVVDRADKQGWTRNLLEAALRVRPDNHLLKKYESRYWSRTALPREELCDALSSAFLSDFEQMLVFELDQSLDSLKHEGFVLDVLEGAESQGWLAEIVVAIHDYWPDNPKVRAIYAAWLPDFVLAGILIDSFDRRTVSLALRQLGRTWLDIRSDHTDGPGIMWRVATVAWKDGWLLDFARVLHQEYPAVPDLAALIARETGAADQRQRAPITGAQLQRLHTALLSAVNRAELERLLRFGVDQNLEELTLAKNLREAMYDVLIASEREGWTRQFMRAAIDAFGDNPVLRTAIESLERELG